MIIRLFGVSSLPHFPSLGSRISALVRHLVFGFRKQFLCAQVSLLASSLSFLFVRFQQLFWPRVVFAVKEVMFYFSVGVWELCGVNMKSNPLKVLR